MKIKRSALEEMFELTARVISAHMVLETDFLMSMETTEEKAEEAWAAYRNMKTSQYNAFAHACELLDRNPLDAFEGVSALHDWRGKRGKDV